MDMFNDVLDFLKDYQYKFINPNFRKIVNNILKAHYNNLNTFDFDIILTFTLYLIEDVSIRFFNLDDKINYKELNPKYYNQWEQNNGQDILALSMLLLPFMKSYDFTDLNHILYNKNTNSINSNILKENIGNVLKSDFKYSNFVLGLIDYKKEYADNTELISLKNDIKLIYKIIHFNFCSLLETFKVINGKFYINWLNIIPMKKDYKTTFLWNRSLSELNKLKQDIRDFEIFKIHLKNNKRLWFGDYYNVIRNGYYQSIKKIKWVIYNRKIKENDKEKRYYMIQYLNKLIDFEKNQLYDKEDYNNLNKEEQIYFELNVKNIISELSFKVNDKDDFSFETIKSILYFMVNNTESRNLLPSEVKGFFTLQEKELEEEKQDLDEIELNKKNVTNENILTSLEKIISNKNLDILWNYLKDTIDKLKLTPYGSKLLKKEKINMSFFNFKLIKDDNDGYINLKNVYNISKILSHNSSWQELATNFKSLSYEEKYEFFTRFTSSDISSWVRINKNIERQEVNNYNYNEIITNINTGWQKIKVEFIWDFLQENGLLSNFQVNLELTDSKNLPKNTNNKKKEQHKRLEKYFEKNKKIFESYYFLTNTKYSKLEKFSKTNNRLDDKEYKKALTKDFLFYTFYAMDWISQINFFNHYFHNQIIYVTGGTGAGKSTQVPKLLLYCLKMYDYNFTGKIICTQPRITPTVSNATRISGEMGVQIEKKSLNTVFKTNQYYLQYKHQQDRHTKENCNHLSLKFVTDGTLLEELNNNILMKKKIKEKLKKNQTDVDYKYSFDNVYDIIVVDEAHEHNTNMDLILTMARHTCFYNNSVKLVIISATMDDDEPIYRNYFKIINDNIVYPIKYFINHPLLNNDIDFIIEAKYLDRRVHISAPGQTTQYKIDEYYDEEIEKKFGKDEKKNSIIAQEKSYQVIIDLCQKYPTGQMLLFLTGEAEIKKALNYLNKNLPARDIALPFYSKMNQAYKDIVGNIQSEIRNIQNYRSDIENDWGEELIRKKSVPSGTYERSIIVATNVAEASITIPGLKFVIDTGYSKVSKYNDKLDVSILEVEKISEASRIQRKGRVGRVSNGVVYYIYGKDKRANIMPKYNITQQDFHNNFLKLIAKKDNNNEAINSISFWDFSKIPYFLNLINLNIGDDNISNLFIRFFGNMIIEGKINEEYFNDYPYYKFFNSNNSEEDFIKNAGFILKQESGFFEENMFDLNGNFYIIHPFETSIKRNIVNRIISFKNKKENKIKHKIFRPMLNNMEVKLQFVNLNYGKAKSNYNKTIYADKINEVIRVIDSSFLLENEAITLLLGSGFDIEIEIIEILSMLTACNYNISSLIGKKKDNPKFIELDNFKNLFTSENDILGIYKICKVIKSNLSTLTVFKLILFFKSGKYINIYKKLYQKIVKKFQKYKFTLNPPEDLVNDWNILNWLKENGKLYSKENIGFKFWLSKSKYFSEMLLKNIEINKNKILKLCERYYLNYNVILKYLEVLISYNIGYFTSDKDLEKDYEESPFDYIKKINNLKYILKDNSIENKITTSFILSNPLNIGIKLDSKDNSFTSIKDPSTKLDFNKLFRNNFNSFVSAQNYMVFYLNLSMFNNNNIMNIIINIDPKKLIELFSYFYNPNRIKNKYIIDNKVIEFEGDNWNNFIFLVKNHFDLNSFPLISKEYLPVLYLYIKSMKKLINY